MGATRWLGLGGHAVLALRGARRAPVLQRDPPWREPQVTLRRVTRLPDQPVRRIRPPVLRPQPPDVIPKPRDRPVPADPLREHRRRHLRVLLEQRPHPCLKRRERRPRRPPLILRRHVRGDRPRDRRPPDAKIASNLPLRNPVSDQPPDQRPILH
jgi:hypothetical protein